jgi:hypothetical protein
MEIRHRLGMKRHLPSRAVAGLDAQRVVNEIKVDLERQFYSYWCNERVTHGSRGPLNIFETQISCVLLSMT